METQTASETAVAETLFSDRLLDAQGVVRRNVLWAMGIGVVPVPLIDILGIAGVQLKQLRQLSDLYDVPFSEHRVKNILASLMAGMGSVGLGYGLTFSLIKVLPFVGHTAGAVAVPITGGALTHALGKIFIQHFESGGTFLDFDPVAVREHFRQEFESAKKTVKDLKK